MKKIFGSVFNIISLLFLTSALFFGQQYLIRNTKGCPNFSKWGNPYFCTYEKPSVSNKNPIGIPNTKTPIFISISSLVAGFGFYKFGSYLKKK